MRIFLDANILFSAAKGSGAIRQFLGDLHADGHTLVADVYVAAEAQRNVSIKATAEGLDYLHALLSRIEVVAQQAQVTESTLANWLPDKDRPVLLAAVASRCDALVTGDRTHFGIGYGQTFGGVTIHSPRQLAVAIWRP